MNEIDLIRILFDIFYLDFIFEEEILIGKENKMTLCRALS